MDKMNFFNNNELDMRSVDWVNGSGPSGTPGCYLKAVFDDKYYKLSLFSDAYGFIGSESVNEVIAYRLKSGHRTFSSKKVKTFR